MRLAPFSIVSSCAYSLNPRSSGNARRNGSIAVLLNCGCARRMTPGRVKYACPPGVFFGDEMNAGQLPRRLSMYTTPLSLVNTSVGLASFIVSLLSVAHARNELQLDLQILDPFEHRLSEPLRLRDFFAHALRLFPARHENHRVASAQQLQRARVPELLVERAEEVTGVRERIEWHRTGLSDCERERLGRADVAGSLPLIGRIELPGDIDHVHQPIASCAPAITFQIRA